MALRLAVFAMGVRFVVIAITAGPGAVGLDEMATLHDGREYMAFAAAMPSGEDLRDLPWAARRLGPGYPALIALGSLLATPAAAALGVAVLGAGLATASLYLLGVSARTAAAFAVLTPSWVAFSATAMSEGPFLALALGGLLALRSRKDLPAGLLFGAATLVRPVGAVLFAGLWLRSLRGDRRGRWVFGAAGFLALPLLWAGWSASIWSGPLAQVGTYARRDGAWPLESLVEGFAVPWADPLKAMQNVLVLGLTAAGLAVLALRRDPGSPGSARGARGDWLWWTGAQTGFYLLLPSVWVFECLARFLVTALPGVAVALDPWLRRRLLPTLILLAAGTGVAVYWNLRALGVW